MSDNFDKIITTNQTLNLTYFITNSENNVKNYNDIFDSNSPPDSELSFSENLLWSPEKEGEYDIEINGKKLSIKVTDIPENVAYSILQEIDFNTQVEILKSISENRDPIIPNDTAPSSKPDDAVTKNGNGIYDWYDLDEMRNNSDEYEIKNNISRKTNGYDEVAGPNANDGKGWNPISTDDISIDGKGWSIVDLFINRSKESGLFGGKTANNNITLKNLGVFNVNITTTEGYDAGALARRIDDGYIQKVAATGKIDVNSGNNHTGGFTGRFTDTIVEDCWVLVDVFGDTELGGLTGSSNSDNINRSYSAGFIDDSGGGFVNSRGDDNPNTTYCYWDIKRSNNNASSGSGDIGLQTDKMTRNDSIINMNKLDFENVWKSI